jgi:hypothetical protein
LIDFKEGSLKNHTFFVMICPSLPLVIFGDTVPYHPPTPKALVRRAIFASNIAIKRYCDKKISNKAIFFCQNIAVAFQNLFKTQAFVLNCSSNNIFDSHGEKKYCSKNVFLSIYYNVFLSFYCNIACKKIARLTRA